LPPTIVDLCSDLAAEQASLDAVVAPLPVASWSMPTPAAGWDIRDSISHLCFFDEAAQLALTDPPAFAAVRQRVTDSPAENTPPDLALGRGSPHESDEAHQAGRSGGHRDPGPLLDRWRASRHAAREAIAAAHAIDPRARVPWFGPPMSLASFATARLMETWAHGADVRDALGVPLDPTPRLRHVIHLGVNARPFAFAVHDVDDPGDPIRVEATAPDGAVWAWGPEEAADRVTGPALDLALVLTQRRHRTRTGIAVTGPTALAWLDVAQAFAGSATTTSPDR
jgi:uncharacterized protein (TIGR03084 family)